MARIRSVKPELFTDPDFCSLSPTARVLYISMFTQADDRGRLDDAPKRVCASAFGEHERVRPEALFVELASGDEPRILRYRVGSKGYVAIRAFRVHQQVNRPQESRLPPPPITEGSLIFQGWTREEFTEHSSPDLGTGTGSRNGNVEQGTWEVKLPPEPATPRRIGKPVDPGVKAAAAAWKAQLVAQGVTMLPQDWSLKACAVVAKALRAGLTPGDLEDAFEWGREQPWFADKLHDPGKLGDLIAQWQQRKVKALATTNGQSKHRLDQHYERLREASREN